MDLESYAPGCFPALEGLYSHLLHLRQVVAREGEERYRMWQRYLSRPDFFPSARNLAHYLALRKHDLRPWQLELARFGLSSLGRCESRVLANLDAVLATLGRLLGYGGPYPSEAEFFAGEARLKAATEQIFGPCERPRILVTLPEEASSDPSLVPRLLHAGANAFRINCAHGDAHTWARMVAEVRRRVGGHEVPILMDLSGPRGRIGTVWAAGRLHPGEFFLLSSKLRDESPHPFQATVEPPELLRGVMVGHRVILDEGKLQGLVEEVLPEAVKVRVTYTPPKGFRLRPEKGLNLPDSDLPLAALTPKDLRDLDFVAEEADLVGYSFVRTPEDVEALLKELEARSPKRLRGLVLKIETAAGVRNLPEILVAAAGRWPTALMIARGDLAVELGYQGLAELQEEILWLAEAASVPVIWATQVLDRLVKKGTPSRAEVSDAVLAARSECVMLNKGPHQEGAIALLADILGRMQTHQYKKAPRLRPLEVWAQL